MAPALLSIYNIPPTRFVKERNLMNGALATVVCPHIFRARISRTKMQKVPGFQARTLVFASTSGKLLKPFGDPPSHVLDLERQYRYSLYTARCRVYYLGRPKYGVLAGLERRSSVNIGSRFRLRQSPCIC